VYVVPVDPKEFSRDEVVPSYVPLDESDLLAAPVDAPPYTFNFGHPSSELLFFRLKQRVRDAVPSAVLDDLPDGAEVVDIAPEASGVELPRSVRSNRPVRHPADSSRNKEYSYADAFPSSWKKRS
jgi:hypothetical protein